MIEVIGFGIKATLFLFLQFVSAFNLILLFSEDIYEININMNKVKHDIEERVCESLCEILILDKEPSRQFALLTSFVMIGGTQDFDILEREGFKKMEIFLGREGAISISFFIKLSLQKVLTLFPEK